MITATKIESTKLQVATPAKQRKTLANDTVGAVMAEYMIIIGLVVFVAVAGFRILGSNANTVVNNQAGALSEVPSSF